MIVFRQFYDTGQRTYKAIESVFIVAPFFRRVRTVLLHPDVDDVCRVTGGTTDPSRCRGDCDEFKKGGFFVVVRELSLHFLVDSEAGSRVRRCMSTVSQQSGIIREKELTLS